jgi:putative tryptophan/tyrosine transport system substrate-binding protein
MMRRRDLIMLIGATAATWRGAQSQEADFPVIGILAEASLEAMRPRGAAFRRGLSEIGYADKRNVSFDWRAATDASRLKALAADLVGHRAALIVAVGTLAATAAKDATASVPIVFVSSDDPVKLGLGKSADRGRNITGVSSFGPDLAPARLGLLRHLVPKATTVALLLDSNLSDAGETLAAVEDAARKTGLQLVALRVRSTAEIEAAFATMSGRRAAALVVGASDLFTGARAPLIALSSRHNIPTIYAAREIADDGGLASYGQSTSDAFRRAGIYAGWILKGAAPADLPILPSAKVEFVINLKSAAGFGLDVPPNILAGADEVLR